MTQDKRPNIEFGTCSWNYDSWIGLVYSRKATHSAAYLRDYSARYPTVEVDSWFYKLPDPDDVREYRMLTPDTFTFSCKLTESISLTHARNRDKSAPLVANPDFLSAEVYARYLEATRELHDRIFLAELEFEYLNKQKMAGLSAFMQALENFVTTLEKQGIRNTLPLAVECRNANYLTREYFQFLRDLAKGSRLVKVYLNNHYEGSAPKSIERLRELV